MLRLLILIAVLFAAAFGFHWLKTMSGEVSLTLGDTSYAVDLTYAAAALLVTIVIAVLLTYAVSLIVRAPRRMSRGWRRQNQERGRLAVSHGLIAVAAGDLRAAERAALEAARRVPNLPLARLLRAQAAQLKGDRAGARAIFQDMIADPETRIAGLRGLYIEAERENELEAARQIAERAREEAPASPWAVRALLRHQTAAHDWDAALQTLSGAATGRILDKRTARRQRAVILTALALDSEEGNPDRARNAALEAHELAPNLVPAAVVAGRLLTRHGDVRRATRVLEAAWKAGPHPELADAYLHVRTGDAAADRLKRAQTLFRLRSGADEGRIAVAHAAIDAREFSLARDMLTPVLTERPTQCALFAMAELVEAETGDSGRAREWMARAVHAPRDPVWTADGVILETWAPASPVTGRIDTVEWKVPVAEPEARRLDIKLGELKAPALAAPEGRIEGAPLIADESDAPVEGDGLAPIAIANRADAATGDRSEHGAQGQGAAEAPPPHGAGRGDLPGDHGTLHLPGQPPVPDDPGVAEEEDPDGEHRRFHIA